MTGPAWLTDSGDRWLEKWAAGCELPDDVIEPKEMPDPINLTATEPVSDYHLHHKRTDMNIDNAFPSKWLKASDFDEGDAHYTIDSVNVETVGQGEDAEEKPVLYFSETEKGLILNKTNANTVKAMYGSETDGWIGKRVTLFATDVQFGAEMKPAVRIRTKAPKANGAAAAVGTGNLWSRYSELAAQALELGLSFPTLDQAANDAEVTAAGKALRAQIEAAKAEAF